MILRQKDATQNALSVNPTTHKHSSVSPSRPYSLLAKDFPTLEQILWRVNGPLVVVVVA